MTTRPAGPISKSKNARASKGGYGGMCSPSWRATATGFAQTVSASSLGSTGALAATTPNRMTMPSPETLLTPELSATICQTIANGNRSVVAAEAAGVSVRTYERWLQKGRQGIEPYVEFLEACREARALAEVKMMATALDGDPFRGNSTGTASFNWLKTSRAKHYAEEKRVSVEVEDKLGQFFGLLEELASEEFYFEFLTAWQDRRNSGQAGGGALEQAPGYVKQKLLRAADVVDTEGEPTL